MLEEQIYKFRNKKYNNRLHFYWRVFDDTFMKPWLIRDYDPETIRQRRKLRMSDFNAGKYILKSRRVTGVYAPDELSGKPQEQDSQDRGRITSAFGPGLNHSGSPERPENMAKSVGHKLREDSDEDSAIRNSFGMPTVLDKKPSHGSGVIGSVYQPPLRDDRGASDSPKAADEDERALYSINRNTTNTEEASSARDTGQTKDGFER